VLFALTTVIFLAGAVLESYLRPSAPEFVVLSLISLAGSVMLWRLSSSFSGTSRKQAIIKLSIFTTIFVVALFSFNVLHSPTGYFRSTQVMNAINAHILKHGRPPASLDLLQPNPATQGFFSHIPVTYTTKPYSKGYNLKVHVGGPLRKECSYPGPNFKKRRPSDHGCKNRG